MCGELTWAPECLNAFAISHVGALARRSLKAARLTATGAHPQATFGVFSQGVHPSAKRDHRRLTAKGAAPPSDGTPGSEVSGGEAAKKDETPAQRALRELLCF